MKLYIAQNKKASTLKSMAELAKLEVKLMKKIKQHKYDVIGGYEDYCTDLSYVIRQYKATEGLGAEVKYLCHPIYVLVGEFRA